MSASQSLLVQDWMSESQSPLEPDFRLVLGWTLVRDWMLVLD